MNKIMGIPRGPWERGFSFDEQNSHEENNGDPEGPLGTLVFIGRIAMHKIMGIPRGPWEPGFSFDEYSHEENNGDPEGPLGTPVLI